MPVGNGSLFLGAWLGLRELQRRGAIDTLPKLHVVQAEPVMPIVAAFRRQTWAPAPGSCTIADGISVADPPRLAHVLSVLRDSSGDAVAIPDSKIKSWQTRLATSEGLFCEPTSAAAFAGLPKLIEAGTISPSDSVLVPITGSGLKDPSAS